MIHSEESYISRLFIHHIGQYQENEGVKLSHKPAVLDQNLADFFKNYFFRSIKEPVFQEFTFSDGNPEMNPLYVYARTIFENPESLSELSQKIAQYLYDHSRHPQIKAGDLLIAHVGQVLVQDEYTDALCIYKSEQKTPFVSMNFRDRHIDCEHHLGLQIEKIDKACVIFNINQETGYKIVAIDRTNNQQDAAFWLKDFLNVQPCSDDYYYTKNIIQATKAYVQDRVKPLYEIDKGAETGILHRSREYLKNQDAYEAGEYARQVFQEDKLVQGFMDFSEDFQRERSASLGDTFSINHQAVKNYNKVFKSILKLDKNFHIYIHGDRTRIERGVDQDGRKYYKLYYDEER